MAEPLLGALPVGAHDEAAAFDEDHPGLVALARRHAGISSATADRLLRRSLARDPGGGRMGGYQGTQDTSDCPRNGAPSHRMLVAL